MTTFIMPDAFTLPSPILTGIVTEVGRLPWCDLCKMHDGSRQARFDGRSVRLRQWGYFCAPHARDHLRGLGIGVGQMLVTSEEKKACKDDPRNLSKLFYGQPLLVNA